MLSAAAAFQPPRSLAAVGLVMSVLASAILVAGAIRSSGPEAASVAAAPNAVTETVRAVRSAGEKVEAYRRTHGGQLPDVSEGQALLGGATDGWHHNLRYSRLSRNKYEVRSAGSDGIFDNADDFVSDDAADDSGPATVSAFSPSGGEVRVIIVAANGAFTVDGMALDDNAMRSRLASWAAKDRDQQIRIDYYRDSPAKRIESLFEMCLAVGITNVKHGNPVYPTATSRPADRPF
jgi:hypothetical protein